MHYQKTKYDKFIFIFLFLLFLLLILEIIIEVNDPKRWGKDTFLSLGNGTYQVVVSQVSADNSDSKLYNSYSIIRWDKNTYERILTNLTKYKIDKDKKMAYFVEYEYGSEMEIFQTYLIVDYSNYEHKIIKCNEKEENKYSVFNNLDDFIDFENTKIEKGNCN